ncbi:MAG TPA: aminotransferase class I/II-fold pyridoxal phosphate-dependent enzyme [Terriglobia bacterium]|jgi:phenylacetate-CoA ligase|nr:aminotransferase class I/II-fold pyridoxal phosphate-dependent enzyme [Terriglobia bacterium]
MSTSKSSITHLSRLHGYWISKRFLQKSQYWPAERRDRYVFEHLRRTLIGAWEGTRYYKSVFNKLGFDPRTDFRATSDLARLPILTKSDVRQHFMEMIDHRHQARSIVSHTSGSTGEPLEMRLSESFLAFDSACAFRHWSWAGYTFRAPFAALRTYVPAHESDPLWRQDRFNNTLYLSAYHLSPTNCREYVVQLLKFRPRFIRGYPSSLSVLAEYVFPHREKFDFVQGIFASSETLLPSERDRIEETFGRKLFNWYGMTEPAVIITECEKHEGMHVNWEYGYAEFQPSDDLPPGEFRLIATGFHNPVMPFVRYDTGDVIRLYESQRNCSCGRNMPLVHSIVGRKDECILMPDGRRLPSLNFYSVFRKYTEVLKFQIVQYGRSEIVVKLLLRPATTNVQGLLRKLEQELRARMGYEVSVELELTDRFLTNADGKTLSVLRRLGTRSVEEKQEYATSLESLALAWKLERHGEGVLKLDWNEADRVPSREVRKALQALLDNDHYSCWYPDPDSSELLEAISHYVGLPVEQIILSHGSDLALELITNAFVRAGDKALVVSPNYDHFRAMVEQRGAEVLRFDYWGDGPFPSDEFAEYLTRHTPRLIYLTNPNNPLGYALPFPVLKRLAIECDRLSSLLILDEAYFEFCGITGASLVPRHSHCIVIRSFSKAFGMAGLRLGYLLAPPEIVKVLNRMNIAKSVTMFAKVAGLAALRDIDSIRAYVEEVRQAKEQFYELFRDFGIAYRPSMSNFITFEHEQASEIVKCLAARNILVRDGSRYGRGKGCVRLTVSGRRCADALIPFLREYFSEYGSRTKDRASTTEMHDPVEKATSA